MQIKIPMRYQYTQIKMGKETNKPVMIPKAGEYVEKQNHSYIVQKM